jgi:hypothetical protein
MDTSADFPEFLQPTGEDDDTFNCLSLLAAVRSSVIVGRILSRVYVKRRISQKLALELAIEIQHWEQSLPDLLRWQQISVPNEDPDIAMTQLTMSLMYFHGIILLTRPFLLLHIKRRTKEMRHPRDHEMAENLGRTQESYVNDIEELRRFSGACVRSALHSINAVQITMLKGRLPKRNPFVM